MGESRIELMEIADGMSPTLVVIVHPLVANAPYIRGIHMSKLRTGLPFSVPGNEASFCTDGPRLASTQLI